MREAEMNIGNRGSLMSCGNRKGLVEVLKRGLRRARRRFSKKMIEAELNDGVEPKVNHR
jgi:hypothetical protein